jgi:hypothetical protein
MTFKHLSAAFALGALSFVVACSGQNTGIVPGASSSNANTIGSPAAQAVAAKKTPPPAIVLSTKTLKFDAFGPSHAKQFAASEKGYRQEIYAASTCRKAIALRPDKAKGPRAVFDVTPVANVKCTITVHDVRKHKESLDVIIDKTPPSTPPSPTPTPSVKPTQTPTAKPTATPTPTAAPTAMPTPVPTATPTTMPGIVNGNFASGSLSPGWYACSFTHTSFSAPVNASPGPEASPSQTSSPTPPLATTSLATYGNIVVTPPPNLNPNATASLPAVLTGGHVAMAGDDNSENTGSSGICQTVTVSAANPYLSFWTYEGGAEYSFKYADQEADVLDSTGTTVKQTLFAELNCFWDPGTIGATGYLGSGCIPSTYGGTSKYADWQGGYWVARGPFDLSAYAGQTVTIFIGVWDYYTDNSPYPDTYGNEIFVGNVQLTNSSTFPPSAKRRALHVIRPVTH